MYTQVSHLNHCIDTYSILDTVSDNSLKFMYTRLWDEYNVNRQIIYRLAVVKYEYFAYVDSIFLPHLKYMRDELAKRKIDVDSVDEELGVKIIG